MTAGLKTEINGIFRIAIYFFIINIIIGGLNAMDFLDDFLYSGGSIIFHNHSGTLGWMTMSVIWLLLRRMSSQDLDESDIRELSQFIKLTRIVLPLFIVFFFINFQFGFMWMFPIVALAALIVMDWAWIIAFKNFRRSENPSFIDLAILLGLLISVISGFIGLLLGFQFAIGKIFLPVAGKDSHANAMVYGFINLIVFGLISLNYSPDEKLSRSSWIQAISLIVGALLTSIGTFFDIGPFPPLGLIFYLLAYIVFLISNSKKMISRFSAGIEEKLTAMAGLFSLSGLLTYIYLIAVYFSKGDDTNPFIRIGFTVEGHFMFAGAFTAVIFAYFLKNSNIKSAQYDTIAFWTYVVGTIGFAISLLLQINVIIVALMGFGQLYFLIRFLQTES